MFRNFYKFYPFLNLSNYRKFLDKDWILFEFWIHLGLKFDINNMREIKFNNYTSYKNKIYLYENLLNCIIISCYLFSIIPLLITSKIMLSNKNIKGCNQVINCTKTDSFYIFRVVIKMKQKDTLFLRCMKQNGGEKVVNLESWIETHSLIGRKNRPSKIIKNHQRRSH